MLELLEIEAFEVLELELELALLLYSLKQAVNCKDANSAACCSSHRIRIAAAMELAKANITKPTQYQ